MAVALEFPWRAIKTGLHFLARLRQLLQSGKEMLHPLCAQAYCRTVSKRGYRGLRCGPVSAPEVFPAAVHEKRPRRIRPISFHPFSRLLDAALAVEVYRLDFPGFPVVRDRNRSGRRKGGGGIHERNVHLACASNKLEVYGVGGGAARVAVAVEDCGRSRGRRRSGGGVLQEVRWSAARGAVE